MKPSIRDIVAVVVLTTVVASGASGPGWVNALKPKGQPAAEIALSIDGKPQYVILLPAQPSTQEQKAADDLAKWLKEVTGAEFKLTREQDGPGNTPCISIGKTALAAAANLPSSDLGMEGYQIEVREGNVFLVGGSGRGPINAVYSLLEEDLGCRWYAAGTAMLPHSPTLRFAPVPRSYKPVLIDRRDPYFSEAQDPDWSIQNRTLGISIPIPPAWGGYPKPLAGMVHTFNSLIPPSEFKDHPEYFSLIGGKRAPTQLCLSNKRVLEQVIGSTLAGLKSDPEARIVDVSPNDGGGVCGCEQCKALNDAQGSEMGTLLSFVNAVADAVKADYPQVRVTTLAYLNTVVPPKTIRPRDNVLIWLCTDSHAWEHLLQFVWEIDTESKPRPGHIDIFDKALQGWEAVGAKMVIWDYPIDYHNCILPVVNMPVVSENMRYYAKHGATGIFQQAQHNQTYGFDRSLMKSWVWAKQMWDLSRDTKELIRDFNYGFYGKAAEPMQQYDDLQWATWERLHADLPKLREMERKQGPGVFDAVLTPEFVSQSYKLMLEAERLAEGDKVLTDRVKLAKLPILYVMCRQGRGEQPVADYLKLVDEFETIAKANNAMWVSSNLRPPTRDEVVAEWRRKAAQ